MAAISNFEDLEIWNLARKQAHAIFKLYSTEHFSKDWELRNQINAASGSVMDNIAEGFERGVHKEFIQFLYISKGSCGEFRSQLYRALDRSYLTQSEFDLLYNLAKEIIVLLQKLIDYLHNSELKGAKFKSTREQVNM